MATTTAPDGVELAYLDEGEGTPVLLLHGMFASGEMNWEWTGIGPALREAGYRTIAPDARGHGASGKPTDPDAYADERFAADVSAILDHLGLQRCLLLGYSMGALTALRTLPGEPRIPAAVLAGVGAGDMMTVERELIALGLEADDAESIEHPVARQYRGYADTTGADRTALAALQRGRSSAPYELDRITVPTLVLSGDDDNLAGSAEAFAAMLPDAQAATVPGDHALAMLDPAFVAHALAFLDQHR